MKHMKLFCVYIYIYIFTFKMVDRNKYNVIFFPFN